MPHNGPLLLIINQERLLQIVRRYYLTFQSVVNSPTNKLARRFSRFITLDLLSQEVVITVTLQQLNRLILVACLTLIN